MKKFLIFAFVLASVAKAEFDLTTQGKRIFESLHCYICHAPRDDAAAVGPSLETIAVHYLGNERRLIEFLKGKAKPIIDPQRFFIMKPQLYKTMHMTLDEYRALAYYLTSIHKNR